MNAITPIKPAAKADSSDSAHLFRSRLVDLCAQAETILGTWLGADSAKKAYLLGAKIEAARKKTTDEKNHNLAEALSDFAIYAELRSTICHAVISRPGSQIYMFRPCSGQGALQWRPVVLKDQEMAAIIGQLERLVKAIAASIKVG